MQVSCISHLFNGNRVVDDMAAFVQSFGDVKETEFNGDDLLRHFRAIYTPS